MIHIVDLRPKMVISWRDAPHEVLAYEFSKRQRQKPVARTKLKNLMTGAIVDHTFQPGDKISEAALNARAVTFIYARRGEYWFHETENPSARFTLPEAIVGNVAQYLVGGGEVTILSYHAASIAIRVTIKVDLRVADAPPSLRGNTSQGGTKTVILETGARVSTPLFVETGDVIRVNTETGAYAERVKKS